MSKKALVTGVCGQDGAYLAPYLLDQGYEVHAVIRRSSNDPTTRLKDLFRDRAVKFYYGNLRDLSRVREIMEVVKPDEVYNLAAQSHVGISFECVDETWDVNYYGVGRVVNEALKTNPDVKIYQASTSEMFGNSPAPQNEQTPFDPQSPYAEAKVKAHQDFIVNKRETQGAFAASGILFNHESPMRGKQFVTRKITYSLARIVHGLQSHIELGNLNAKRDWGYAGDYVKAMYLMLQLDKPEDFVIASGETRTVRDFVDAACRAVDITLTWEGEGENERGIDTKTGNELIRVNPEFYRPQEVNHLLGDARKAKEKLGWEPEHSFDQLVEMMVKNDLEEVKKDC